MFVRRLFFLFVLSCLFCCQQIVNGQYYFGQNKIQYNRFDWQVLNTKHFDVYFYPEMDTLAGIGALYAENIYDVLQEKFNYSILRRIPLIVYSSHFHFEETNILPFEVSPGITGLFEYMKGRVVVPCDGSIEHFRNTIHHELVHVFQKSYLDRVLKDHRIQKDIRPPLWFTEGLADYLSETWNGDAEMFIRDGILNNTLVPIHRMYRILNTFLMYKEGQSIIRYIVEHYGEEKILYLFDNIWKNETFEPTFQMILGKDYKALSREWTYDLKKIIYPLMLKKDLTSMVTNRITNQGYNSQPVYYKKNGQPMVVFVANRDGYSGIYQKPLDDSGENKTEILLKGERTPELESFRLQKGKIDISEQKNLAFIAKSGPRDVLYVFNIPQRKIIHDFNFSRLVSLYSPSWSPDGTRLVFSGLDRTGKKDLYILTINNGEIDRLTNDFHNDQDPDWSPNGNWVVFSSDRTANQTAIGNGSGVTHLCLYDLTSSEISGLTTGRFHDESPSWSSDGQSIVFTSDRDSVSNIWILEGKSSQKSQRHSQTGIEKNPDYCKLYVLKQVTNFATGVFSPSWTDEGSLLFTAFENYGYQIREYKNIPQKIKNVPPIEVFTQRKSVENYEYPGVVVNRESFKIRYKKKFTLDIAQSQLVQDPIFGTYGGGQLVVSDMLGNEKYYFMLSNNARTKSELLKSFNFSITRVDLSRRINYSVGLYRLAGYYYNHYNGYYYENRYGGMASVSYPLNKFERLETSINLRRSVKEHEEYENPLKTILCSNFISYTKDNALWGVTGPVDGVRYKVSIGHTIDLQHSKIHFATLMFDFRKYFRLGHRFTHAVRVWGQFNHGIDPTPFFMGGSWDLRGYKFRSLWGPKLFLFSNELRFPFLDQLYFGFPFGGIGFGAVQGALFLDAGNVWDQIFGDLKGSYGFSFRIRLAGVMALRLDIGNKTDFKILKKDTFTHLFFGWDF